MGYPLFTHFPRPSKGTAATTLLGSLATRSVLSNQVVECRQFGGESILWACSPTGGATSARISRLVETVERGAVQHQVWGSGDFKLCV